MLEGKAGRVWRAHLVLAQAVSSRAVLQPSWGLGCRLGWVSGADSGVLGRQKEKYSNQHDPGLLNIFFGDDGIGL